MNPADLGQLCPLHETTGQSGHVVLADCRACAEIIYLPPYEVYATSLLVHAVTSVILVSAFQRSILVDIVYAIEATSAVD